MKIELALQLFSENPTHSTQVCFCICIQCLLLNTFYTESDVMDKIMLVLSLEYTIFGVEPPKAAHLNFNLMI